MERKGWKNYEGKRVYIRLNNGRIYTGLVIEVDENVPVFLTIKDKFDLRVTFSVSEILTIQEEAQNENRGF
jgi:small nuclear ribonucleoprotein (snRNP)-like protein